MILTHASLFSGIGGVDLGAEAAGFTTCFQCEINPFAAISSPHASLTAPFTAIFALSGGGDIIDACRGVPTVLSGGFPCQPVSLAGSRKGSNDTRWLWPEYLRLIRECKPKWIVAENVAALLSIPEFKGIYRDLQAEGYEVGIYILSASGVGAPHQRRRCFVVANSCRHRLQAAEVSSCRTRQEESSFSAVCSTDICGSDKALDTDNQSGLQEDKSANSVRESRNARHSASRLSWSGFSLPDWSGYPSAVCRMDDGFSRRLDKSRLQALGNAVVPRCVFPIFDAIARIERGEC